MNNRVPPWVARLLLMIPCVAFCVYSRTSNFWVFFSCGLIWTWMMRQDTATAKRWPFSTSPSNMILRAGMWFTIPMFMIHFTFEYYTKWWAVMWEGFGLAIMVSGTAQSTWRHLVADYGGYWANLPWPWNIDPPEIRTEWLYPCPKCNARNPAQRGICWRCNYGADGDSTAYYQKYGIQQPQSKHDESDAYAPIDPNRP